VPAIESTIANAGHADALPTLRPINVIARAAKQSILSLLGEDGLRRYARNDVVTIYPNNRYASAFSRHDFARVLRFGVPLERRGSRECRMRAAPAVSCAKWTKESAHEHTGQRRQSDIPCAMALRLISRSPRRIGLCCLRRLRIAGSSAPGRADLPSADLTPTAEASGPHDFAVRFSTARQHVLRPLTDREVRPAIPSRARCRRVHHIPSQRSVTMANAPSSGTGWRES
jgi:hypothetical protein